MYNSEVMNLTNTRKYNKEQNLENKGTDVFTKHEGTQTLF